MLNRSNLSDPRWGRQQPPGPRGLWNVRDLEGEVVNGHESWLRISLSSRKPCLVWLTLMLTHVEAHIFGSTTDYLFGWWFWCSNFLSLIGWRGSLVSRILFWKIGLESRLEQLWCKTSTSLGPWFQKSCFFEIHLWQPCWEQDKKNDGEKTYPQVRSV